VFSVQGSGVQGLGFRVQGAGFRVLGLGFGARVEGLELHSPHTFLFKGLLWKQDLKPLHVDRLINYPQYRSRKVLELSDAKV